jgi:hypothetical protein
MSVVDLVLLNHDTMMTTACPVDILIILEAIVAIR